MEKWKLLLFGLDFDCLPYVNCLGYPPNAIKQHHGNRLQDGEHSPDGPNRASAAAEQQPLVAHACFAQIEKDLDRTFQLPAHQREAFARILRRISNHFPAMGYTQGINFIVGYLLIIGYSEFDAFWMFTHIALNRRYMLLGLFEDGFPLSGVYSLLFKNLLRRHHSQAYAHLYEVVMIDESLWVFKWFITYYLYSFPLEMCQYVWDVVISLGGVGLVTFAVSLVSGLSSTLLLLDDPCDISEFFQTLKQVETFNRHVNIREAVKKAYTLQIEASDLEGLESLKNPDGSANMYAEYFLASFHEEENRRKERSKSDMNCTTGNETTSPAAEEALNYTNPLFFRRESTRASGDILEKWYNRLL